MKKLFPFLLACLIMSGCSSDGNDGSQAILENVLTLELSFGDDENNLPAEYLLARPRDLVVHRNGDTIVVDEDKVKIFDSEGKPKLMRGGEGQGPGEFDVLAWKPRISGNGFLSVQDQFYSMNLYGPDYEFLKKENLFQNQIYDDVSTNYGIRGVIYGFIYLDDTNRVLYMEGDRISNPYEPGGITLLGIHNGERFIEITKQPLKNIYITPLVFESGSSVNVQFSFRFLGQFLWAYSTTEKLVYVDTGQDIISGDKAEYELKVYSISDGSVKIIKHEFERTPIEDEMVEDNMGHPRRDRMEDALKLIKSEIMAKVCNASLQQIKTDGEFVYAFTYNKNEKEEILTDVFNINTGKHISTAWFPMVPSFIKDGFAYLLIPGSEENFPRVEKYRISPEVYGN
ncbi:MAG: hypothetical protein GY863_05990 [bacterium]|nr:hypothetical protein [bacterium]